VTRKRSIVILLVAVGVLGTVLMCTLAVNLLSPGEHESLTTDTDSAELKSSAERVAFLGRYLKLRTRVSDARFQIVYHDNSQGIPGPSDWSIAAVVQVTPGDGPAWLVDARPLGANDPAVTRLPASPRRLIPASWQVSTPGVSYIRDGALLVWHAEGVLEFADSTL
jgi:hypothetical protein